MAFEKTVQDLVAGRTATLPPLLKREVSKTLSKAVGKEILEHVTPSSKDVTQFKLAANKALVKSSAASAAFLKLSPSERRKVSALAHAGAHGGKVSDAFKKLSDGCFKGVAATGEQLKKGLELAKAQKVNLEAATW